jgi:hypothetical protein
MTAGQGSRSDVTLAFDDEEALRWTRHKLEHENDLVNHRLSWLATSQAFLVAAYVIRFDASNDTP